MWPLLAPVYVKTHTTISLLFVNYSPAMEALYLISGFTTWTTFGNSAAHTTPNTNFWFFELMFIYKNGIVPSKLDNNSVKCLSMSATVKYLLSLNISALYPRATRIKRSWRYPRKKQKRYLTAKLNQPFPSPLVPLFQSESKCENDFDLHENETACTTHLHMKGSHLDSFWYRGTRELGNGLFARR